MAAAVVHVVELSPIVMGVLFIVFLGVCVVSGVNLLRGKR